jgi:hypothetical protein
MDEKLNITDFKIIKIEEIEPTLSLYLKSIDVQNANIKSYNKSSIDHKLYNNFFVSNDTILKNIVDKNRQLVETIYKKDFEMFNYEII